MNLKKMAAEDAARWAYAEMFFGEGAGTKRKLISAEVAHKVKNISDYQQAFEKAYNKQNFADHALRAAKERQRIDRGNVVGKNARALIRGDRRGLSTSVFVLVSAGLYAHQSGLDKVIIAEGKKFYRKLENTYNAYKNDKTGKHTVIQL